MVDAAVPPITPEVLLSLQVYGYASGTFSSRKIERATYDSLAFRYLAAGSHPDHDTLAQSEPLWGRVLRIAGHLASVMTIAEIFLRVSLDPALGFGAIHAGQCFLVRAEAI